MTSNGPFIVSQRILIKTNVEQLNEQLQAYAESNLKQYADGKFENFMLFKHPMKTEVKEQLETLVRIYITIISLKPKHIQNPFKIMKLWVRWEMIDIIAFLEAVDIKAQLESKKHKRIQKKESDQKELQKLNQGKNTLKSIFQSQDQKVNKITTLTRSISDVS